VCPPYQEQPENKDHIILCKDAGAHETLVKALKELNKWFCEFQMDNAVLSAILEGLQNWYEEAETQEVSLQTAAVHAQRLVRWNYVVDRWFIYGWREQQEASWLQGCFWCLSWWWMTKL